MPSNPGLEAITSLELNQSEWHAAWFATTCFQRCLVLLARVAFDPVMPIARLAATVHHGIDGDTLTMRLTAVVNDERKTAENRAPDFGFFDHAPPRRIINQRGDGGFDSGDESVCNAR